MAIIITNTASCANHIKDAFRMVGRDHYPFGVYQAIYDLIETSYCDNAYVEFDVIAWCCNLSESELKDYPEFYCTEELAESLSEMTTVLYYDNKTVYHLAY